MKNLNKCSPLELTIVAKDIKEKNQIVNECYVANGIYKDKSKISPLSNLQDGLFNLICVTNNGKRKITDYLKIKRGKHTTRAARLMPVASGGIVVDTPGFSAAELEELIPSEELAGCFPEFHEFVGECYYNTCTHTHEPNCGIKNAVENGRIEKERYEAYKDIYEVLKENNSRRRRVK